MSHPVSPILHHFEASPFSEKIRVVFGFKRMAWRSVLIPRILPKPDLMPLTGGYRRTPVMQIGADVYCDTQIIVRAIEKHFPSPPLFPPQHFGSPAMIALWTDRAFFECTVRLVFGTLGDKVPQAFIEDRTKLRGAPFDVKAMTAGLPHHRDQFRAHAALLEAQLSHSNEYLLGYFTAADAHAYMNVWYVRSNLPELAERLLSDFPRVREWETRVRTLGYGTRSDISGADALAIARNTEPATLPAHASLSAESFKAGDRVTVGGDEPAPTPVEGELVALSSDHVAIRRTDPAVGFVTLHFPRLGFVVKET